MPNSSELDWVNHGPELDELAPEDRCHYIFQQHSQYEGQSVNGRPCGLPMQPFKDRYREPRCHFHPVIGPKDDKELKLALEAAAASEAYLGEALLAVAELAGVKGRQALLPHANLGRANLQGADFSLLANLQAAHLSKADLQDADLRASDLQGADLSQANLHSAKLAGAWLRGADLSEADLQRATLCGANLEGATLEWAALANADLTGATITPCQETDSDSSYIITRIADLRNADLRGALLAAATIAPEADLTGVSIAFPITWRWLPWQKRGWIGLAGVRRWWRLRNMRWGEYHIRDERCAHSDQEWEKVKKLHSLSDGKRPTFADCEAVYRQLKLNYQESGDYQTAGEFFVREMECKRAQMVKDGEPLVKRFWPALMYFLCAYGERPKWIAAWAAFFLVLFAFVHGFCGLNDGSGEPDVHLGWHWWGWEGLGAGLRQVCTALYFSVVTFTSLGYGDLQPATTTGRAFACVEAALGIVIMSLFLICVVRKYSR